VKKFYWRENQWAERESSCEMWRVRAFVSGERIREERASTPFIFFFIFLISYILFFSFCFLFIFIISYILFFPFVFFSFSFHFFLCFPSSIFF